MIKHEISNMAGINEVCAERKKASVIILSQEAKDFLDGQLGESLTDVEHSGIKGMKWGVRRFQNPDGTLTPEGRKRYSAEGENGGSKRNSYNSGSMQWSKSSETLSDAEIERRNRRLRAELEYRNNLERLQPKTPAQKRKAFFKKVLVDPIGDALADTMKSVCKGLAKGFISKASNGKINLVYDGKSKKKSDPVEKIVYVSSTTPSSKPSKSSSSSTPSTSTSSSNPKKPSK